LNRYLVQEGVAEMGDQFGGAERRLTRRTASAVAACVVLAFALAPAALADDLKPDPSPASGGLAPDSAASPVPAPAQRTAPAPPPKPVVRATPRTARVAPVVTRTVVMPVPAASAPVTRVAPKPAQPKPKPARVVKPKPKPNPKPRVSRPHRVLPFGMRVTVAGPNTTVGAASLALPAAFAFVALLAASGGFLALIYRLRQGLVQV
jgi:hypothetical protein